MSKPKPRASEPPRPSVPAGKSGTQSRNVSQPGASTSSAKFYNGPTELKQRNTGSGASTIKTVPPQAAAKSPSASQKPAAVAKISKKSRKRTSFGLFSLISLAPILVFASLFSTILCPPPQAPASTFSRIALSAIGRQHDNHSPLHKALCYPANVYHKEVLEPYVYPVIADVQAKITAHPVYKEHVEPKYNFAKATGTRIWEGPVKPIVDRTCRGARKFYLTYVAPHEPYIHAKYTEYTAPIVNRVSAAHKTYVEPHVNTAGEYAYAGAKTGHEYYRFAADHPITHQAGKHAQTAFSLGRKHGYNAYVYAKPHALTAWDKIVLFTKQVIIPKSIEVAELIGLQIERIVAVVKRQASDFYKQHLAEHLDPYVAKINETLAPVIAIYKDKVYTPYIAPAIAAIFPETPEAPKSFWAHIADKLPSLSTSHVDTRGSGFYADDVKEKAKVVEEKVKEVKKEQPKAEKVAQKVADKAAAKAEEPKKVVQKVAEKVAEAAAVKEAVKVVEDKADRIKKADVEREESKAEPEAEPSEAKSTRAAEDKKEKVVNTTKEAPKVEKETAVETVAQEPTEIQTATGSATTASASASAAAAADAKAEVSPRDAILEELNTLKKRINRVGKDASLTLEDMFTRTITDLIAEVPKAETAGLQSMDREIKRMLDGLDRLYTRSTTLTKAQVAESIKMSDNKVKGVYDKAVRDVQTRRDYQPKFNVFVDFAHYEQGKAYDDPTHDALGARMSGTPGITTQDWQLWKSLKKDSDAFTARWNEATAKPPYAKVKKLINQLQTDINEAVAQLKGTYESWQEQQDTLRRTALTKIEAREHVAKEAAESKAAQAKLPRKDANGDRVSIQPVPSQDSAAGAGSGPVIGKSKEQVEDALKAANAAKKDEL
ncbi:uncharacterized protein LOC62_02G001937 [Vanrija pseudolonga]|uniref:Uncharacterized protein n=1 Tax=Vanrija pseudolonga TaxID=143232 RepID=A0AAF1BJH9_9TREE|nr:hypothetical protein LOC62_02G001937 [Vanrija pseudolonga]